MSCRCRFRIINLASFGLISESGERHDLGHFWFLVYMVPGLIAVIDVVKGEAVGTSDYRYGVMVFVLGISPSMLWTSTERGTNLGGPKGFDMDIEYRPGGIYTPPISIIDEHAN